MSSFEVVKEFESQRAKFPDRGTKTRYRIVAAIFSKCQQNPDKGDMGLWYSSMWVG